MQSRCDVLTKVIMVLVGCFVYAIGYYHRNCTSVLLKPIADSLNVSESQLGVLSSTYFWSYAIIQPFVGSLSDLFDTSYIVSSSLALTFISSLGCAFSRNFYLTCFLRLLVGLGCGCLYVPVCRAYAQWFSPRVFPYIQSTVVACGGLGGLLAQAPLGKLNSSQKWPIAFYIGSSISFILSFFAFFFLKGSPKINQTKLEVNLNELNEELNPESNEPKFRKASFKESMVRLVSNVKKCISFKDFWLLAFWKFFTPSTYSNVSSTWGASYMKNGLGYSPEKAANYISMTSFAWTVGAPFLAVVSNWIHTRKWCLFVCTFIATLSTIFFTVIKEPISDALILAMLFIFALTSGASLTIAAITFKEMLSKELVGTLMGCGNLFLMVGTSIEMDITSAVVSLYEKRTEGKDLLNGYKYGLWLMSAISCGLSLFLIFFLKDTYKKAISEANDSNAPNGDQNSIQTPIIEAHSQENNDQ